MNIDPAMPTLVIVLFLTLIIAGFLKLLKQPHMVAYIVAGALIGPSGLGLVSDPDAVSRLGAMGVVLLLFFVGLEYSPRKILAGWRVSVFGTLLQITFSVFIVYLVGLIFDWSMNRIVLLGFVISLSSTAVILNIVAKKDFVPERVSDAAVNMSIMHDIALIPMLLIVGLLSGTNSADVPSSWLTLFGAVILVGLAMFAMFNRRSNIPFGSLFDGDSEMQTMAIFAVCLGLAAFSAFSGLSTALGAFVAGMLVASFRDLHWARNSTEPLRQILMAVFFMSIGMMLDFGFLLEYWLPIIALLLAAFGTNIFVNALALRATGMVWPEAIMAGALLSQIGELSFILAAIGLSSGVITGFSYQATIAVIALSLLTSPLLINVTRVAFKRWEERESRLPEQR